YQKVSYANIVLDAVAKMVTSPNDQTAVHAIKGSALFYRSLAFYGLVQTFARPYDSSTSAIDPGIPLLLSPDVNSAVSRSSVQTVYDQIILDLSEAEGLLPLIPSQLTRPSGLAAQTLLAKVYLAMGNYQQALAYSTRVLDSF